MARFIDSQDAVTKLKSAIVKYIFIGVSSYLKHLALIEPSHTGLLGKPPVVL